MAADRRSLMAQVAELSMCVEQACFMSRQLLAGTVSTVEALAVTHEEVAETLEMLAKRKPGRAAEYRARCDAARMHAERERRWVREHSAPRAMQDL